MAVAITMGQPNGLKHKTSANTSEVSHSTFVYTESKMYSQSTLLQRRHTESAILNNMRSQKAHSMNVDRYDALCRVLSGGYHQCRNCLQVNVKRLKPLQFQFV